MSPSEGQLRLRSSETVRGLDMFSEGHLLYWWRYVEYGATRLEKKCNATAKVPSFLVTMATNWSKRSRPMQVDISDSNRSILSFNTF